MSTTAIRGTIDLSFVVAGPRPVPSMAPDISAMPIGHSRRLVGLDCEADAAGSLRELRRATFPRSPAWPAARLPIALLASRPPAPPLQTSTWPQDFRLQRIAVASVSVAEEQPVPRLAGGSPGVEPGAQPEREGEGLERVG